MAERELAPKQAAFVQEYLIDLNATQAAIRAGYSEKTAYSQGERLLSNVEVRAAINAAQTNRAIKTELNAEWVLTRLQQIADICMKEDDRGRIDSAGANKATELIGKHLALFTDKVQTELSGSIQTTLSPEDKLKIIAEIKYGATD